MLIYLESTAGTLGDLVGFLHHVVEGLEVLIVGVVKQDLGLLEVHHAVLLGKGDQVAEGRLGNYVKDSVEDGFAVGGDDASAFGKDPNNGVNGPDEDKEVGGSLEGKPKPDVRNSGTENTVKGNLLNNIAILVVDLGVKLSLHLSADVVKDGDEVEHGESKKDPLVGGAGGGADEASSDHENVLEEEVGPGVVVEATKVHDAVKHERSGDDPVKVASIVELAAIAAAYIVTVASGHGKVGDRSDEAYDATEECGLGNELEDALANERSNTDVNRDFNFFEVHNREVAVDVVDSWQEQQSETNP